LHVRIERFGAAAALAGLALAGCGDAGVGTLRVQLSAEETITEGLAAGPAQEDTRDYSVSYTKFLAVIGRVKLARSGRHDPFADDSVYIADMRQVGAEGLALVQLADVPAGQWDQFSFETPLAVAGAKVLPGVAPGDAQLMIERGLTYWIEGSVAGPERPVSFVFQLAVPTLFADCESNGEPGVAVGEGGISTATITLHGDHLWFDSFPTGDESTVTRRAAWLVQADRDGDGMVSTSDLASVRAEDVFPSSLGYNLSGSGGPIVNALDFVRAQLATQGHLNGEGDCTSLPGSP
jgi:hypothetical protein